MGGSFVGAAIAHRRSIRTPSCLRRIGRPSAVMESLRDAQRA